MATETYKKFDRLRSNMPGNCEWMQRHRGLIHIRHLDHSFPIFFVSLLFLFLLLLLSIPTDQEARTIKISGIDNDLHNIQFNMVAGHRDLTGGDEEDESNPEEGWAYVCILIPVFIGILILMEYLHRSAMKKKRRPPPIP